MSGTDTTPDAALLDGVRYVLGGADDVEQKAVGFLRAQNPSVQQGDFRFQGVDFPWEDKPDLYVMEFTLTGDDTIWRVDVEGGEPKSVWPR